MPAGVPWEPGENPTPASTSTDNSVSFDATAPTVSITSPASGASVSGTISVTASASDNAGVVGVQFQLDRLEEHTSELQPHLHIGCRLIPDKNAHTITAI